MFQQQERPKAGSFLVPTISRLLLLLWLDQGSTLGLPRISHQLVHVGDSSVPTGITLDRTNTPITLIPYCAVLLAGAVLYPGTGNQIIYLCVIHLMNFIIDL